MIKKSLVMGFTTGILMIIGLVVQHILAKYLTLNEYGIYALMFSWIGLLSVFSLNSFNTIVTKASAQNYPRFFKTASKICFLFSLLGSIALLVIGFFFEVERLNLFILLAIFFPFYGGINFADSYLIGSSKFNKYSVYMITSQCIIAGLQIISVVFLQGVFWLLFFTLLGTSMINLVMTFFIYKNIKQEKDDKKDKELTKYGIELTGIGIFSSIASRIQYIILAALAGTATLAIYAVSQIIPERIKGLIKGILSPFSIYLASNDKERSIKIVRKATFILLLFSLSIILLTAIILPVIIKIIFGLKYEESIIYSLILLLALVSIPLDIGPGSIMVYQGFKKFYAKITLLTNLIKIIGFIIFIPLFKIYGIIITIVLASLSTTIINLIWFYKLPKPQIKKSLLILDKKFESDKYENIIIKPKINGQNIINIIESDYLSKAETYPLWIRIIAKLTFTKKV